LIGGNKTRKINCKIIVATNIALKALVSKKLFREDLYFRLARFEINLPALRERKEDIPQLIQHFLFQQNKKDFAPSIHINLLSKLTIYEWPGNIRELKNAIERMKILHSDKKVFGLDEFEFDQLESFSPESIPDKTQSFTPKHELALEGKEEEELRVKKIIEKGFKIESRAQYLKEIFTKYKKLSRSQVVEILKVSPLTAANTLQALCEENLIVKRMPSKSTKSHYYELKD
jgi:DNA-binding NtrC family response regulator